MKYQAYAEYKDSGVEWLGIVPSHWESVRLKYVAILKSGKIETGSGYRYVGMENIESGNGKYLVKDDISPEGLSTSFSKGDVLFGKLRPYLAKSWSADFSGICSSEFLVLKSVKVCPRFLNYYTLTDEFIRQVDSSTYGSKMPRASWDFISLMDTPVPQIESEKIANFLDHETAKIDSLIEKQQQLIKLLKEKRQAVISHAVTKGLNPNAPMRDSGVEWLGDVPEHWTLPKIKWFFKTESGGTPNTSKFEAYYQDGDIPWIRTTDLNNSELFEAPILITKQAVIDSACSWLPENTVLVAMYGGAGSIGKHAILKFISTINQAVCAILPNEKIDPNFLHLYVEFYRQYWMVGAEGTRKDPNINQETIRELMISCPPLYEQIEIIRITKEKLLVIDEVTIDSSPT
ncbi:restriction endonuclease subunit S [Methylobacter sp. G7]|uniref:restriction endonuclease subunit S n=1 Tax=Methylobacter sp. G7 TaxID=3230117 RepID=UPI003D802439